MTQIKGERVMSKGTTSKRTVDHPRSCIAGRVDYGSKELLAKEKNLTTARCGEHRTAATAVGESR